MFIIGCLGGSKNILILWFCIVCDILLCLGLIVKNKWKFGCVFMMRGWLLIKSYSFTRRNFLGLRSGFKWLRIVGEYKFVFFSKIYLLLMIVFSKILLIYLNFLVFGEGLGVYVGWLIFLTRFFKCKEWVLVLIL